MLPEPFFKEIEDTMRDPNFPFENMTMFVIIGSLILQEGFYDSCKNKDENSKYIKEIMKVARALIKKGIISEKLYGWKKEYRKKA